LFFSTGVELKKNKFKYLNLLDASLAQNNLSIYDENKVIITTSKKMLLYDLQKKKMCKKYIIRESGNIIGVFKKDK